MMFVVYGLVVNVCISFVLSQNNDGMLHPRESETREIKDLSGMWNFRADTSVGRQQGFKEKWFSDALSESGSVIPMPVPSSYNDITQDKSLRDFIGWVWYDREFYIPASWTNQRVVLRLESVRYYSIVWVNGIQVAEHEMGRLPFEAELGPQLKFGAVNRVTVAVNNTLSPFTLPPGKIEYRSGGGYPEDYFIQVLQFGFFNYAGIDRSVRLYTTPSTYIDDITVITDLSGSSGILSWNIVPKGSAAQKSKVAVEVLDRKGASAVFSEGYNGKITLNNVIPWWPYSMNETHPAYLYTLKMTLKTDDTTDIYRLPFGFRTVSISNNSFFINHRPFYCHGVGKHEDYDVRGKGMDYALIARDFSLLKWLGVNCFRTSHYPYAEEIMDQADQQGIVVIDECPAIGLIEPANFNNQTLSLHKQSMRELIRRDKNRPAVIMWSIGNEPISSNPAAGPHFGEVIKVTKALDPSRPLTFASNNGNPLTDHVMNQVDVVCVNVYFGWYSDMGHIEVIKERVKNQVDALQIYYNKPVMVTEYGAESLPGLHVSPSFSYSEEYQHDLLAAHHSAFDQIKGKTLAGEMIWNFADFLIDQEVRWSYGCHKGLFTRQRQPKLGAHIVRKRYHKLMNRTVDRLS